MKITTTDVLSNEGSGVEEVVAAAAEVDGVLVAGNGNEQQQENPVLAQDPLMMQERRGLSAEEGMNENLVHVDLSANANSLSENGLKDLSMKLDSVFNILNAHLASSHEVANQHNERLNGFTALLTEYKEESSKRMAQLVNQIQTLSAQSSRNNVKPLEVQQKLTTSQKQIEDSLKGHMRTMVIISLGVAVMICIVAGIIIKQIRDVGKRKLL